MTTPVSKPLYTAGYGVVPSGVPVFETRDPSSSDLQGRNGPFQIQQTWVNSTTQGIWVLQSISASAGVLSGTWRAIAPVKTTTSAPTTADYQYPLGQIWVNTTTGIIYMLAAVSGTTGTWDIIAGPSAGDISFLQDDAGANVTGDASGIVKVRGQATPSVSGIKTTVATNELDIALFSPYVNATPFVFGSGTGITPGSNTYPLQVASSNSGNSVGICITNNSNTASSNAQLLLTVGGTSAGDPFIVYAGPAATWTNGVHNSDSDKFKIAAASGFGSSVHFSITTAGVVNIPNILNIGDSPSTTAIELTIEETTAGLIGIEVRNKSTNAAASSYLGLVVNGGTASDPFITYNIGGVTSWAHGIDNSDSDSWKLSASSSLGTTDVMVATTAGAITKPLQPSFSAYQTATDANQTGDGTAFLLGNSTVGGTGFTERFDQSSSLTNAATAGGIFFTAPVAGKYRFTLQLALSSLGAAHTSGTIAIVNSTQAITYTVWSGNPGAVRDAANLATIQGTVLISCAASDVIRWQVTISGSTKTVNVLLTDTFVQGDLEE